MPKSVTRCKKVPSPKNRSFSSLGKGHEGAYNITNLSKEVVSSLPKAYSKEHGPQRWPNHQLVCRIISLSSTLRLQPSMSNKVGVIHVQHLPSVG